MTSGALGENNVALSSGQTHDVWFQSTVAFFCVALVPSFIILMEMNSWTVIHVGSVLLSVVALFVTLEIVNVLSTVDPDEYGVVDQIYSSANAWLTIIIT